MTEIEINLLDKIDRIVTLICMAEEFLPMTPYDSFKNTFFSLDIERLEKDTFSIKHQLPKQIDKETYYSINEALKQIHDAIIRIVRMFLQDIKIED